MEIDDFILNFIISYIAGSVPELLKEEKRSKTYG